MPALVAKLVTVNKNDAWKEIEEEDDNMLVKLPRPRLEEALYDYLQAHAFEIERIVRHHLSLGKHQRCEISPRADWLHGSFNACIPITVTNWRAQRVLLRCPFPHMFGGLAGLDEKIRCEAATFAWISQNCPRVPIPHLWGFGLPSGLSFKPSKYLPWYRRGVEYMRRCWAWVCRRPYHAPYSPSSISFALKSGYMLVDFIEKEQGIMLSSIWHRATGEQRQTLYKSLSRIMLDLAHCPLPRIGSFTIHDTGEMSLSNRPLTVRLPLYECEGIPTNMPRGSCYSDTAAYARDLLHCQDMKLKYQPNSVRDEYDAEAQMAVLTIMRALVSHYNLTDLRSGPFCLVWTDPHSSNIFVNQRYEITSLPDLEWFCALPIETLHPPFWPTGRDLDQLGGEDRKLYDEVCREFMEIFELEDRQPSALGAGFCTQVIRDALQKNTHWFWTALNEPRAMYNLFLHHLQPGIVPKHLEDAEAIQFQDILAPYFIEDADAFIRQKASDRENYLKILRSQRQDLGY